MMSCVEIYIRGQSQNTLMILFLFFFFQPKKGGEEKGGNRKNKHREIKIKKSNKTQQKHEILVFYLPLFFKFLTAW
jgi:hypothetical protein